MKADVQVYIVLFSLLLGLCLVVWSQNRKTENPVLQQITQKAYGTNTTLVDSLFNTWTFNLSGATLTYNWQASGAQPLTIWDSDGGACNYSASIASLSSAVDAATVVYLNSGIVLGQTPMYIDEMGIQRTFQLKMYAGDVRIESTNGERAKSGLTLKDVPAFWSIWTRDITEQTDYVNTPTSWPLPFSDVIWQNVGSNFGFVAQFMTSGDLVAHPVYNNSNFFQASTWSQPSC